MSIITFGIIIMPKKSAQHLAMADLPALHVLLQERHISKAAKRYGISQSAMSKILFRAQERYGDELLKRTDGGGYRLTDFATKISEQLSEFLPRLRMLEELKAFPDKSSARTFRVSAAELESFLFMTEVFKNIYIEYPQINFHISQTEENTIDLIKSGNIDLAFWISEIPDDVNFHFISTMNLVALISNNHFHENASMTIEEFISYEHVKVYHPGKIYTTYIDRSLSKLNMKRKIRVETPYFFTAAEIAAQTNLIAHVPKIVAQKLSSMTNTKIVHIPEMISSFELYLVWRKDINMANSTYWIIDKIKAISETLIRNNVQAP